MVAYQLISASLGVLNPTDTGTFALGLMDELHVSQLPVVNDKEYLGLISDTDIYTLNILEEPVHSQKFLLDFVYVKENQHIYEVMKIFSSSHLSLLPVVDDKNQYLGCIALANLVQQFAEITANSRITIAKIPDIVAGIKRLVIKIYCIQQTASVY